MMVFCSHCGHAWEPDPENTTMEAACPSCFASFRVRTAAGQAAATGTLPTAKAPAAPTARDRTTEEQSIYADGSVAITTARVTIHGTTYGLRDITSVKMAVTHPARSYATALMTLSLLVAGSSLVVLSFHWRAGLGLLLLAVGGWFAARAWSRTCGAEYHLILAGTSGEKEALRSTDGRHVNKIVESINCAIALYH